MTAADVAYAGIVRQAEMVRRGEIGPRELVELYLERIARFDRTLNSYRVVLAEEALAEARTAERLPRHLPLRGVPVAVKDNQDVAGQLTTHGTGAAATPARTDCELVRRLREAGAIVIGKTTMPELALFAFSESPTWGVTRNPWAPGLVPGGSSGGSAAAVAAGLVGAGTASDGGGSIRIPAAACGLFGLKPQRGRVPLAPDLDHWYGLTVFGFLTRTVSDTALLLDVSAGTNLAPVAAAASPGRLRVAVSRSTCVPARVPASAFEPLVAATDLLRSLGHEVVDRDVKWRSIFLDSVMPRYLRGAAEDARKLDDPERLEPRTHSVVRAGRLLPDRAMMFARSRERTHAARILAVFEEHDVVLSPVLGTPPVEVGRWTGKGFLRTANGHTSFVPFTPGWNALGNPAATVPMGVGKNGLPLSIQIAAAPGREDTLVSLAAQIEGACSVEEWRPALEKAGDTGPS